jgi:hypothetical protein
MLSSVGRNITDIIVVDDRTCDRGTDLGVEEEGKQVRMEETTQGRMKMGRQRMKSKGLRSTRLK